MIYFFPASSSLLPALSSPEGLQGGKEQEEKKEEGGEYIFRKGSQQKQKYRDKNMHSMPEGQWIDQIGLPVEQCLGDKQALRVS